MGRQIKTIDFFYRLDVKAAHAWERKIQAWLKRKHPSVRVARKRPEALIVLGGDGTILEATRKYKSISPLIIGLNLGHVGFLATARERQQFLPALDRLLAGQYFVAKRMMLAATVIRKKRPIFTTTSLNEIAIQNPLGMVELSVTIEGHPIQCIKGTGVLIASATGSTAYNLSAHGPIVMPDIKCLVITELLDHNIPTPSIVIKRNKELAVHIMDYRKRQLLMMARTRLPFDVVLMADSEEMFPLEKGDTILVRRSPRLMKFVELDKNYFFKSLEEKFAFR